MVHTAGGYSNYREYSYPLQLDGMNFYYGVISNIDSLVLIYTLVVGETHCEGKCGVTTQRPNPEPGEPGLLDAEASALGIEIPLFRLPQPKTRLKVQTTCYFNNINTFMIGGNDI